MSSDAEKEGVLRFFYGPDPTPDISLRWEHIIRAVREPFFRQALVASEKATSLLSGSWSHGLAVWR